MSRLACVVYSVYSYTAIQDTAYIVYNFTPSLWGETTETDKSPPPRSGGTRTASIVIVDYTISDRVA